MKFPGTQETRHFKFRRALRFGVPSEGKDPVRITKTKAVRVIVNTMTNAGFMSGWFGDDSREFRDEQVESFLDMDSREQREWVDRNHGNLTRYCRVPEPVLAVACLPWPEGPEPVATIEPAAPKGWAAV